MRTQSEAGRKNGRRTRLARPNPASGWNWRWVGWASWRLSPLVLWICGITVALDVASSWWERPDWYLGRMLMSPAIPLGHAAGGARGSPQPRVLAPLPCRVA